MLTLNTTRIRTASRWVERSLALSRARNRVTNATADPGWITCLLADQRGVSSVELGLVTALILAPLASVFDLGMAFSQQIKLQQAVQAGAQYASMNIWNSSTSPTAISNVVTNSLPASLQSAVTVYGDDTHTAPYEACFCPTGTTGSYLQSADNLSTCGSTSCADGEASGYYVIVAASLSYTPIAPYSFAFMSNPQTLTASSVVRVQ